MTCRGRYQYQRTEKATISSEFLLEIPIIRTELDHSNRLIKFMRLQAMKRKGLQKGAVAIGSRKLWIRYYFDQQGGFLANNFIEDYYMASIEIEDITEEEESEAMK
mmetsp:Transcript_11632/g.17654  ORF Transcript_11632/g.17654 Transcript_11632/m.17654 type:complete len:106 (-) Transcript_11632:681-998(-)